jgi:hypothetical protein
MTLFSYQLLKRTELDSLLWVSSSYKWILQAGSLQVIRHSMQRGRFKIVIEVTWQINTYKCVSSVMFLFRRTDLLLTVVANLEAKWICVIGALQLFTGFDSKTGRCHLNQSHMTNGACSLTPINYCVLLKRSLLLRTFMESRLSKNNYAFDDSLIFKNWHMYTEFVTASGIIRQLNSTEYLASVIMLLEQKTLTVFRLIGVTWPSNFSTWLSSFIFSFRCSKSNVVLRSKSHQKWVLQSDPLYLFCRFHSKICGS